MGRTCCLNGRVYIKGWVKNLKETDYLGSTRGRWEDKTETDLQEIGWECLDCIHLALDRAIGGVD
jgi:hypothetical protein